MSSNSPETKVNPPTPSDSSGSSGDLLNKDKYPQDFPAFHPINRTPQWRDLATLAQSRVMTANDGTSNTPPSSNLAGPAPRRTYRHIAPCPAGTTAPGTPPNSSHARVHTGTPSAPTLVIVHQQQTPPATHGLQQQNTHTPTNPNTISLSPWAGRPINASTPTTTATATNPRPTYTARQQLEDYYRNEAESELERIRRQRRNLLHEEEALRGREQELTTLTEVLRDLPGNERCPVRRRKQGPREGG